jgi:hypothetical protein
MLNFAPRHEDEWYSSTHFYRLEDKVQLHVLARGKGPPVPFDRRVDWPQS